LYKAWVNDGEGALDQLAASVESKPFFIIYTPHGPASARLRASPRFIELVRKPGLLDSLPRS
jgi:hypothetical protein